jgi:hypothetical protein
MPGTPRRSSGYPGRDQLDAASMQFRRAVARLYREGERGDPETAAKLKPIIERAVWSLEALAGEAERAEQDSARNRKRTEDAADALERQMKRAGMPVPARLHDRP